MTTPILHSEDDHRLVFEAPRMGSTILGSLAALVLLGIWAIFPEHRIAQGVFLLMAIVGFAGLLHVHRLVLDLDDRTWTYRKGWAWQGPVAQGSFDDLGRVAIEANELQDGLVASKIRSRLLFLEFDRFDVPDSAAGDLDGRFPLSFAMGPNLAPDKARGYADRLGIEVVDRTVSSTAAESETPPEPGSDRPERPPNA